MLLALGLLGGCGDDEGVKGDDDGGADAGDDGSMMTVSCPSASPELAQMSGACCSYQDNATQLDMPEFRVAALRILEPASLASPTALALLKGSMDQERLNWVFRLEIGNDGTATWVSGPGTRSAGGNFAFFEGEAPAPGATDRWNPIRVPGTMTGEVFEGQAADRRLSVPTLAEGTNALESDLPFRRVRPLRFTLSEDRTCIGVRKTTSYSTMDGFLTAYMAVEDMDASEVKVGTVDATLCAFAAGLDISGGNSCAANDRSTWQALPNAICDADDNCARNCDAVDEDRDCPAVATVCDPMTDCNAYFVASELAAHGVNVTGAEPEPMMDAGVDASMDAEVDAAVDAAVDAGMDAEVDAAVDAGADADTDAGV